MKRSLVWGAVVIVLAFGGGAFAQGPQITDIAGDANGLVVSQDTRPASYDPADLLEVRFRTTYQATPVGDDGIDYVPTGLAIHFDTLAPVKSDGPTVAFTVYADLDGCSGSFRGFVGGPLTNPGDGRAGSAVWSYNDCPEVVPVLHSSHSAEHERFTALTDPAGELVVTYPFEAFTAEQRDVLDVGTRLDAPRAYTQTSQGADLVGTFGLWVQAVTIDWTDTGAAFVVGEDVPPDVPCTRGCP
jgi:hypothetical protein